MPEPTIADRVLGCLLGGALGDALGAPVEFLRLPEILRAYGRDGVRRHGTAFGTRAPVTDDTQLTAFGAEGLIRAHVRGRDRGIVDIGSVVYFSYLRWLPTQGRAAPVELACPDSWLLAVPALAAVRAPGVATLSGLAGPRGTTEAPANRRSKGCGAVMRSAPFGLLPGDRDVWQLTVECASLTHGHPSGVLAAGALAVLVRSLVRGGGVRAGVGVALAQLRERPDGGEVVAALEAALAAAGDRQAARAGRLGEGWVAEECLGLAVWAALTGSDVLDALSLAVTHDGDSDSTGAVCGNIVGAAGGVAALPADLLAEVDAAPAVRELATDFVTEFYDTERVSDAWGAATERWVARYPGC